MLKLIFSTRLKCSWACIFRYHHWLLAGNEFRAFVMNVKKKIKIKKLKSLYLIFSFDLNMFFCFVLV